MLSAFHSGWGELSVGNWIARLPPRPYRLQPTGWMRTVSGIQSLLSADVLALGALSYLGQPFYS